MGFFGRLLGAPSAPSAPSAPEEADYELEPRDDDEGGGFVVRRVSDGQRLSWQTLPKRHGIESVKIVGVSYHHDALQDPSFAPGQVLELVPEPDNPHDPNAVAVWNASQTLHVGYVPREYAAKVAKGDHRLGCMVIWETRNESGQRVALRALMVDERAKVRGVSI